MQAEIIIVPTPSTIDALKRSAQTLAQNLVQNGLTVNEEISLCPDRRRLQHTIAKALDRSAVVFTLGGMGRDSQFLTKQVISEGLGLPLENSRETLAAIREFSSRAGFPNSPDDATMASLPAGSQPLIPAYGVIPGCIIASPQQHIVLLPENEQEILPMLKRQILPMLFKAGLSVESTHEMRTYGANEGQVRQLITDLMGTSNPTVTTRTEGDQVVVKVAASARNSTEATNLCSPLLKTIATRLGDYAYGLDVDSLESALLQKMGRKELTLSVAEAGTEGTLIRRINSYPKGRDILVKGVLAEDNESKISRLGIPAKLLKRKGDVSEYTAIAMANAAREQGDSEIGAGICMDIPGSRMGGEALAYIAVCDDSEVYVKKVVIAQEGSVADVIGAAVSCGLNMIRLYVDYLPDSYHGSIPLDRALAGKVTVTDKESYEESQEFAPVDDGEEPLMKKSGKTNKKAKKAKGKTGKTRSKEEKSSSGKARKIILFLAVLIFLGSAGYLGMVAVQSHLAKGLRDNLATAYDTTGFNGLKSLNPDTVAFVSIEGTEMRYPVVQSKDNDYYLRRDFKEKSNQHGVPFMDYRNDSRKPDDNMVIYGHNMKDGQIFGELLNYKDMEYYKQHPTIDFDTPKKNGEYKIFAVFVTSASTEHFNDGKIFDYHLFFNGKNDAEFEQYVKQVRVRSIINFPVDVEAGDEIITLSTCDYDLFDSRFVVMARRVRGGESSDVDVNAVEANPTPLYPDAWYKTYGGTKPDVDSWNYSPPASGGSTSSTEEEKDPPEVDEEESSQEESSKPESSKPESSTSKPESSTSSSVAASQAAASQAAVSQAAASQAAVSQAAVSQAAASQAAASQAAAQAAEQSRLAAESKAASDAANSAEKQKEDAEAAAIASAETASQGASEASAAQRNALNASSRTKADEFATAAGTAATKAENAASAAKTSAEKAGTNAAHNAAEQAASYARDARQSALTAEQTARDKDDGWDYQDTSTGVSASVSKVAGAYVDTSSGLKVKSNVSYDANSDIDIISRIVQQEVGSGFHAEAIKAQAVATYTFIKEANGKGSIPTMPMATRVDAKVKNAVSEVIGQAVYYNGRYAFTPYHATSAGATTSSASVWGGSGYSYLRSVDSSPDESAKGYETTVSLSADKVSALISSKLGIETDDDDPESWFQVLGTEEGGYNGLMSVCGESKSRQSGSTLTGRLIRETVLNLRSAAFDVAYDYSTDTFTFTTYGYGHGVGMSQNGANGYAKQGWSYVDILTYYYAGTSVK